MLNFELGSSQFYHSREKIKDMLVLGFLTKLSCPLNNPQKKKKKEKSTTHKTMQYLRPQTTSRYSKKQYIS